jgi:hypothetical protein
MAEQIDRQAKVFRPLHPAALAALAFGLGVAVSLPFGLATARANAIIEPGGGYNILPYIGLGFFVIAFVLAHLRRPAADAKRLAARLIFLVWMIAVFPIWSAGEVNTAVRIIGSASLVLLLVTPWWLAALSEREHFFLRRLVFGVLYWGGFVLALRLFPTFNITSQIDVEYTSLDQTRSSLKLYAVLLVFWLAQIGAVLLARRLLSMRKSAVH